MKKRIFILKFLFIILLLPFYLYGFINPDPAVMESVNADSTSQITWVATNATGGVINYRFTGDANSTSWQVSRTNIVPGLLENTRYYERVQMTNITTSETNQWSNNEYCYTLLSIPQDSDINVVSLSYNSIRISASLPVNFSQGLTGCQFSNFSGGSHGGVNSSALTGIYVYTNTGLSPNEKYGYKVRYKNGDGIWTICNANEKTNYTLCRIPNSPTLTCLSANSIGVVINSNNNPSNTLYSIKFKWDGTIRYVQNDYSLNISEYFQSRSAWSTIDVTGLSFNTAYTVSVRAQNAVGSNTAYSSASYRYTAPAIPGIPGISTVSPSSLNTDINENGNPSITGYSVMVRYGITRYVQNDKSLGAVPYYDTKAAWGTLDIVGMSPNTSYTISVNAVNGDSTWTTSYSTASNLYTAANVPSAPNVLANYDLVTNYFTKIDINPNGNPSYTRFAVYSINNSQYLQGTGSTGVLAVWHTESWWESNFRNYHINLNANTTYSYRIYAMNEDDVITSQSAIGSDLTPPASPTGVSISEINDDVLRISWNASTGALSYYVYFVNNKDETVSNYNPLNTTTITIYTDDRDGGAPPQVTGLKVTNTSAVDTSRLRLEWNIASSPASSLSYYYRVRARKADGKEGAFSSLGTGASNVTPVITGYKVFRGTSFSNNSVVTFYTDTGLNANTGYDYQVKAVSSDDISGLKSTWASNYTAIQSPLSINFGVFNTNYINLSSGESFNNLNVKNSGLYFSNETNSANSGWIQVNNWTSSGLSQNIRYGFRIKARNAEGLETPWCSVFNKYTRCQIPMSPDIGTPYQEAMIVIIKSNNNPYYTEYAVSNVVTHQFVQPDGSLNSVPAWQTYTLWGGASGISNHGLSPSVNYSYTVIARNGDNIRTTPSAASIWKYTIAKAPSDFRSAYNTTTNILLAWHNEGASFYGLECALDDNGLPGTFISLINFSDSYTLTNYNHIGLWPSIKYWYRISGYNGDAVITISTNLICILTVITNPEAPSDFAGAGASPDSILWSWQDNSFSENYFIVKNLTGSNISGLLNANTVYYLETSLLPNTLYTRYVMASNTYGKSDDSNTYQCATLSPSANNLRINIESATYKGSSVKLEWDADNVTSYGVERALSVNDVLQAWSIIKTGLIEKTYIDNTVKQSNTYYYRIISYNQLNAINTNRSPSAFFFIPKVEKERADVVSDNYITSEDENVEILVENPCEGRITIKIYTISGRHVKTVIDSQMPVGTHLIKWNIDTKDNKKAARGIYLIQIKKTDGYNEVKKIIIAK